MALPRQVYLKLMLDIKHALEREDQEDIKFLSRAYIGKDALKKITNFLELVSELEQENVLNEGELSKLVKLLDEINRQDLVDKVQDIISKHGNHTLSAVQTSPKQLVSTSLSPLQTSPRSSLSPLVTSPRSSLSPLVTQGGAFAIGAALNPPQLNQFPPLPHSYLLRSTGNTVGLDSYNLETDLETDSTTKAPVDLKSLTSKTTTLMPYQDEVAQKSLRKNTVLYLPVNGGKEKVAVYIWKEDARQKGLFKTLIFAQKIKANSFERIFRSEAGDEIMECVEIYTPENPQVEHIQYDSFHLIIIDECDSIIHEIESLNMFLNNHLRNQTKIQPRLLGFMSGHIEEKDVEAVCQLLSASEVSYVNYNTSSKSSYCHPAEEDNILSASNQSTLNDKLTERLKSEFYSKPLSKGIIITKSDKDTNKVYTAINSCDKLHCSKFKVTSQKLLRSFNQQTLTGFKEGRFNVLIATDCILEGDVELPDCQFLYRYNLVEKKMGTVQAAARSQTTCSKCYLIVCKDSQEYKQECENREQLKSLLAAFDSFNLWIS